MSGTDVSKARLAEYRQERAVNLLRNRAQGAQGGPARGQVAALLGAEVGLARTRRVRTEAERADPSTSPTSEEKTPGARGTLRVVRKGPDLLGSATTGIEVKVHFRMDQVPTSIAHLLDASESPLVSLAVTYSGEKFARLRLTSYIEGYSAHATDTIELMAGDPERVVHQLPTFFPQQLDAVRERTRAMLHIQVDDLGTNQAELHRSFPIWLLPRTTACLSVLDPSRDEPKDLTPYLGAYVTPNVQAVMEVLREAAELVPAHAMVGYQGPRENMADTVRAQVRSVYEALRAREITYVNSVICFGGGRTQILQRVRMPRESLESRSANCIDGTVLMASVLEAASLEPAIVLVPGHAFLGFATTEDGDQWEYVETTMLGSASFDEAHKRGAEEATEYSQLAEDNPTAFKLLPLSLLRTHFNVLPME